MKKTDENIENQLGDTKKGQPFRVPENYFEAFADRLMIRIAEEEGELHHKKRLLPIYLRPVLMVAASIVLVMLLFSVPTRRFFSSDDDRIAQQQLKVDPVNRVDFTATDLISYFSEGQFLLAVSDMKDLESKTLTSESLADYITANYSEYDLIANN
jgi:hypothetical protein